MSEDISEYAERRDHYDLGVVIVTYDATDVIEDCLETLFASAIADGKRLAVAIVDNASNDGTVDLVTAWRDGRQTYHASDDLPFVFAPVPKPINGHLIDVIEMPFNKGFAGGVNAGLKHLARLPALDRFWVLNPDSVVPSGTVAAFASAAVGRFSLMGGRVLYFHRPDMVQIDGGRINRWTGVTANVNLFSKAKDCEPPDPSTLDFITGASMVVSREFLEARGPMIEDYFLYCEEVDWALRREEFPLAISPEARIYHRTGSAIGSAGLGRPASPFSLYFHHRARLRLVRRRFPGALPTAWAYTLAKAIQLTLKGYRAEAMALLRGAANRPPPPCVTERLSPDALHFATTMSSPRALTSHNK